MWQKQVLYDAVRGQSLPKEGSTITISSGTSPNGSASTRVFWKTRLGPEARGGAEVADEGHLV